MKHHILRSLRGSKKEREEAIGLLVKDKALKNNILKYVRANSGTEEDGITVYSDAVLAFAKQVFDKREFNISGKIKNYLFGVARFIWLAELRKRKKQPLVLKQIENLAIVDNSSQINILLNGERSSLLQFILGEMKVNCKKVLMYWANGYKMKEIAEMAGYKSEGVARKKKSECFKELLQFLESKPHLKEQLR